MSIKKLLNDNNKTFYWIGFLLADGYFSKLGRLRVQLAIKDLNHLQKLSKFLDIPLRNNIFDIQDKEVINNIKLKFNIITPKTYNPPNIEVFKSFNNDLLMSLIIGFIDGDGSITNQSGRNDNSLRIKNHSSWINVLKYFHLFITSRSNILFPSPKINKDGYAELQCCNMNILKFLKSHIIKYKLPVLDRKWDKIDLNRISMYDMATERRKKVWSLRKQGLTYKEICGIVGITKGRVSRILNE